MKYTPLDYFDQERPLTPSMAYAQSAQTLDTAARLALKLGDTEALMNIAVMWANLANAMSGDYMTEPMELGSKSIGFTNNREEEVVEDGESDEPDE